MKVSVLIPTKNPGIQFTETLDAVLRQETPWPFEILVVDSGSSDGTVALCESTVGVRLHRIAPEEFGHGKTRNLGIALTSGEMIAVITQDALPVDNRWLVELVAAVEQSPDIAGAFGRHLPHAGCNPFVARNLTRHFDNFANGSAVTWLDDKEAYERDVHYRQFLHFFSNNNACIRRSVWQVIPYPEVDFAEDQLWAKKVIEAGFKKAYADKAKVFHSHNYGPWETLCRSYDESRAFSRLFSYSVCPSIAQVGVRVATAVAADYRHWLNMDSFWRAPQWFAIIPAIQLCRHVGLYLGTKAAGNYDLLDRLFSLDQAVKRKG